MAQPNSVIPVFIFSMLFTGVFLDGSSTKTPDSPALPNEQKRRPGSGGIDMEPVYDFKLHHPATYDTAQVAVANHAEDQVHVWIQTAECYQCKMILLGPVNASGKALIETDTAWPVYLELSKKKELTNKTSECYATYHFKENGNYTWNINVNHTTNTFDCNILPTNAPPDTYIPIYVAMAVLIGMAVVYAIFNQLWKVRSNQFYNYIGMEREVSTDLGTPSHSVSSNSNNIQRASNKDKPKRLTSLDAFRGLSLAVMIFVNYGSGYYRVIGHSRWNGLTVADLVFPWFIWIMGVSITLSFHAQVKHGVSRWAMLWKITKRFVILFGLGIILDGGTDFSTFRVPGVLQRIAASYYIVATLHLMAVKKTSSDEQVLLNPVYAQLRDILDFWYEWLVMLGLLALHICLTFFLPVPGCPTGYLGPGGPLVGEDRSLVNCTGGAATYIDNVIFTANHTYHTCTAMHIYKLTMSHDPEGILGTLTACFTAFLGLQAGKIFHIYPYPRQRVVRFTVWCIVLGVIGGALCGFSKEGGLIPVNKNLWSVSFMLATASMAFFLLTVFYFLVDVHFWWTGMPFIFLGMNSIVAYCGSEVLEGYFPFSWTPVHNTHAEKLAMNLIGVLLWVLITYFMYTVNFFVKV